MRILPFWVISDIVNVPINWNFIEKLKTKWKCSNKCLFSNICVFEYWFFLFVYLSHLLILSILGDIRFAHYFLSWVYCPCAHHLDRIDRIPLFLLAFFFRSSNYYYHIHVNRLYIYIYIYIYIYTYIHIWERGSIMVEWYSLSLSLSLFLSLFLSLSLSISLQWV